VTGVQTCALPISSNDRRGAICNDGSDRSTANDNSVTASYG